MLEFILEIIGTLFEGLLPAIIDKFKTFKKYKKTLKFIMTLFLVLSLSYTIFIKGIIKKEVDIRIKYVKLILQTFITFSALTSK
jgi:hypothetical protein